MTDQMRINTGFLICPEFIHEIFSEIWSIGEEISANNNYFNACIRTVLVVKL